MKKYYLSSAILVVLFFSCTKESNVEFAPPQNTPKNEIPLARLPLIYDEIYEIRNGKEINLTHTQSQTRADHEFYDITTTVPHYIFPGSVLTKESINKGVYIPVGTSNSWKKEIRVYFSLPIKSKVIAPKKAALQDAIADATHNKDFTGKQSQMFSYKMKEFSYYKELKLAFGANVNIANFFTVNLNVNNGKIQSNTALFVEFSQIYFNVGMDFPDDGNIFINEETRKKHLPQNPVYVGTVNYGRKGIIVAESSRSYNELSVAIRTAFNAKIVKGELSLNANTKEILNEAQIQICIIGGDGKEATKTTKGFHALQEFIIKGGVFNPQIYGVPISFTGVYAKDNSMFVTELDI